MRQHKYRAYNKKLKSMAQVLSLELDSEFGGVEVWGKASVDFETGEHDAVRDFWSWDECEEMEFTGLKDKSGKDAYIGDIVKLSEDIHVDDDRIYQVTQRDTLGFVLLQDNHEYDSVNLEIIPFEIIGNAYEHPELAKEQDDSKV